MPLTALGTEGMVESKTESLPLEAMDTLGEKVMPSSGRCHEEMERGSQWRGRGTWEDSPAKQSGITSQVDPCGELGMGDSILPWRDILSSRICRCTGPVVGSKGRHDGQVGVK